MQELQVEGDLIVTGNISSAIIDSLQNEINNLQNQLNEYSEVVKLELLKSKYHWISMKIMM